MIYHIYYDVENTFAPLTPRVGRQAKIAISHYYWYNPEPALESDMSALYSLRINGANP